MTDLKGVGFMDKMLVMEDYDSDALFVLRRAFLFGVCRRADVNRAFDTHSSPNRAGKILKWATIRWPAMLLYAPKRGVFPRDGVPTPPEARASAILELLERGADPRQTGIFPGEGVPILRPEPMKPTAGSDLATQVVLEACLQEKPLRMLYVGMRQGETARWREIVPRGLEFTGLYWRLHAQDLGDKEKDWPMKVFVLARILEALPSNRKIDPSFRPRFVTKTHQRFRVSFSEHLTEDQCRALSILWGIQDGKLRLPRHGVYDFQRNYTDIPPPSDIVWPPITRMDPLEE